MPEAWAPALEDVARHIPTRTRVMNAPGQDRMLGTFTSATTPTDEQAQAVIDDAVNAIIAQHGVMPPVTDPDGPVIRSAARSAAEWRAAADIEIAYPVRDADVQVYAELYSRAALAESELVIALQVGGEGEVAEFPAWSAPNPPVYADRDPGDYSSPLPIKFHGGP